ncbi:MULTISPECIES: LuxR C-terminal-related transcriptional regulator [Citrobacter]|jgi:DNA-binding CsgD family transcriptional regulator|uniref:LuxR C-terminal-related transcriptional regulator n=1 Tax=Citrobacter meridianamericanus TaxID=2894201 RepID=A0ABT1B2E3_9ENTR|nr:MULTISPECIES: LuxR C-terminal-related transcriptional regulator [Citrobacter]MCO5779765.1 LuxR C-terminal-related transcriptional regulator [Citrobacter meridianamericanus]MDG5475518.1 LuxR C-terminal-related transcriptional regulator [Citrobacter freundii]MDM2742104.1 LuxR C-terminal-related transcriptional regulator [Citrobacter sp. Cu096]HCW0180567.1 LuxR family transcriptional regulator [Citrobacter freundii]
MNIIQEHAGNAELWVDDIFIRQGLKNIIADIVFEDDKARLVFFTANHFEAVKKQNYDLNTHRLVLLIDGHLYQYLNEISFYRLPIDISVATLKQFIIDITGFASNHENQSELNISLTARDKYILTQLGEGRTIFEISALLNLHLKTIYQARQNLIKKLGCSGLIDFQGILQAQIFRNWLKHA